ncbi:MAG: ribosome biogenesis GTP-binding protein YihA/YsxC [Deltaproteobacteria bacterium]
MADEIVKVADSEFVISAAEVAGAPVVTTPEICFVGRSNVGKSSALNALLGRRKLARVSNTPGRTRLLNFFRATFILHGRRIELSLCDLPGYGYAKAAKSEVAQWRPMIERYLKERERLAGVVVLLDSRHEPSALDHSLVGWLSALRPILIVATKADKVPKNRLHGVVRGIERQLALPAGTALALSSETGHGLGELRQRLMEIAGGAPDESPGAPAA